MVSVIGINPSTNNLNQVDIAKKRTIINALNTIDINNNYELKQTTDAVNSIFLLSVIILTQLSTIAAISLTLIKKKIFNFYKNIKFMTLGGAALALGFNFFNKYKTDNIIKSESLTTKKTLNTELTNPKIFATQSDEIEFNIKKNPIYQQILNSKYSNTFEYNGNLHFSKNIKYLKKINKDATNLKYNDTLSTSDTQKIIKEIENKQEDYFNKINKGINTLNIGFVAISSTLFLLINKYIKKRDSKMILNCIALITMLMPLSSFSSKYDVEKISKYKAKDDCLNNINNPKDTMATTFDYLKNKSKYKKEIQRLEDLTLMKNTMLKKFALNNEEMKIAQETQKEFIETFSSKQYQKRHEQTTIQNNIVKETLYNSIGIILFARIIAEIEKGFNKSTIAKIFATLSLMNISNILLANYFQSKNKTSKNV